MRFSIDTGGDTPIYLQIMDQVRYAVSVGDLRPGDRLPSIRDLEAELDLNRNTARRAYLELAREGMIVVRQGRTAVVAPRRRRSPPGWAAPDAGDLARRLIREIEGKGWDALRFVPAIERAAVEHDARNPKWIFVECSAQQADDLARAAGDTWKRRVVGLDLALLRKRPASVPPSAAFALTTGWHRAEVERLLGSRGIPVREVTLRPSPQLLEGIRRLEGREVGLLLRDAESIPGYRSFVRRLVAVKGSIPAALLADEEGAEALFRRVEGIIYTAPCRDFIRERGPGRLIAQDLLLEPDPADLERIGKELDPPRIGRHRGREEST